MRKFFAIFLAVALFVMTVPTVAMADEPDYAEQIFNGMFYLGDDSSAVDIDLHENTELSVFIVMGAENLETVDLSGCTNLFMVVIIDAPSLTSVDLSGCTGLSSEKGVKIVGVPALTTVDVTGCASLPLLYLMFSPEITTLSGLTSCVGLTDLRINGSVTTKLGTLDLTQCPDISVVKLSHDISFTLPAGKTTTDNSTDSSKVLYHKMYFTAGTDSTSAQSVTAVKTDTGATFDLKALIGAADYNAVPGNISYLNGVGTVITDDGPSPYEAIPAEKGSSGYVSFPTNCDYLEWCVKRTAYVEDHVVAVSYMEKRTDETVSVTESVSKGNVASVVADSGKTIDLTDPAVILVPTGEVKEKTDLPAAEVSAVETKLPAGAEAEMWLDLNLLVVDTANSNKELGRVSQVSGKVKFSIDLPQEVLTAINLGRYVYVARSHDGVVDFLNVAVENGQAVFETDRFSTYALVTSNVRLIAAPSHHHSAATPVTVSAAKTADCGVVLYGALCVGSLLGTGWVIGKKK